MPAAGLDVERALWSQGYHRIVGVDEAGRGSLAGPVVVAAVILNPDRAECLEVDDSKKLSESRREALFETIISGSINHQIEVLGNIEIDPSTNTINARIDMVEETIVKCMQLHILDQLNQTLFVCKDAVKVTGTNLIADCERLEVTALSDNITNSKSERMTNMKIVKIKADEHQYTLM